MAMREVDKRSSIKEVIVVIPQRKQGATKAADYEAS